MMTWLKHSLGALAIISLASCSEDTGTEPFGFLFEEGMQVEVEVSGDIHDTTYEVDYPDRQITYVEGRNRITGTLTIDGTNPETGTYSGGVLWHSHTYTTHTTVRTYNPGTGVWDTSTTHVNRRTELLPDSAFTAVGDMEQSDFTLGRYQIPSEDRVPVFRQRTALEFRIISHNSRRLRGYAGYSEERTKTIGSPDSIHLKYYYSRSVWDLDTLVIRN